MIIQKDFLNKLKDFGLNSYESKLWAALLSRGVSTAGELSDIANVPRSRSYDVLESLEKKGFIMVKIGKPIKYIAVPPEEVLERVKKRITSEAEEQTNALNQIKDSNLIKELSLLHSQGVELVEPFELSGSLKGRKNLYNHLEFMIKGAEKSVVISTTTEGLLRKRYALKSALKKAKEHGAKIRIAAPITNEAKKEIKDLQGFADIRHSPEKARFVIVDGKHIIFMLLNDTEVNSAYDTGIWVDTPFFASTFEKMFDTAWVDMKPVK
ncbi:MAG: TrmB family transcriptional regulator [bacterium]|nr:TrmB family transcriptional regulator [bacterium]